MSAESTRGRHWWIVRCTALLIALLLTSGCGGGNDPADQAANGTGGGEAAPSSPAPTQQELPEEMMDLIGRDFTDAHAELVGYNVQVTRRDKISAEKVGTVIAQSPQPGDEFAQRVELTVAIQPPDVPDVTGVSFGEASRRLEETGFEVVEVPVFDESEQDGLVVSQDPPAGATNAGEVRLTVSRRPVVKYIADMEAVSQSTGGLFEAGTASTNGEPYTHALTIGIPQYSSTETASSEYDLSRDYRRLVGDVGLDDRAVCGTRYKVEVYGDERQLFSADLALGEVAPIDVDVTDVLRLELAVTKIAKNGSVVFADVRVQGLEEEVGANAASTPSSSSPPS